MNEQVTEAQLFELLGRLYASREMLRLQTETCSLDQKRFVQQLRELEEERLRAAARSAEGTG